MSRRYKAGADRHQSMLLPERVEDYVGPDNPVRALDAYVDSLDLAALGFTHTQVDAGPGQPPYPPAALLKLYLYGYLMRVRSGRKLEQECHRNLEVLWLLEGLKPTNKTIANFRKDNAEALQAANRDFVLLCRELDLFGRELVAIDGSFFGGDAGSKSIHSRTQLKRRLQRIEADIAAHLAALDAADTAEAASEPAEALADKLAALRERQAGRLQQIEASGENQLSEVDPDARRLQKNGQRVCGYNVQMAVDGRYKLLIDCAVTNEGNDTGQLEPMAQRARLWLGTETLDVVADAGYFNPVQLKACADDGITPWVAEPAPCGRSAGAERLRQRAALAEHPFGTLKRACGWDHFLVRGLAKVRGEMALLMLTYNLRRVLSLLGPEGLRVAVARWRRSAPLSLLRIALDLRWSAFFSAMSARPSPKTAIA